MMDWILQGVFTSMWGWIGTAGVVVIACLAVAWFIPPLRQIALSVAGVAIAAATIYSRGQRDARRKWDDAIKRDIEKGQQARSDAERDVDAGRVRGDEWDRSKR